MKQWIEKKIPATQGRRLLPWEPNIYSKEGGTYLKVNPGTINGQFLPVNWEAEFLLSANPSYVKLVIDIGENAISQCQLEVDGSDVTPALPSVNFPPAQFTILVGLYFEGVYYMMYEENINIHARVLFERPKSDVTVSPSTTPWIYPFDRYYTWEVL